MFVVLFVIGLLGLRYIRPAAGLLVLGIGLWLLAVVVIFPITGGGLFATNLLFQSPLMINAIYLGIGLAYASVLIGVRSISLVPPVVETRRALFTGLAATAASFLVTIWFGRSNGTVRSALPLASIAPEESPTPEPSRAAVSAGSNSAAAVGAPRAERNRESLPGAAAAARASA
jgi:hypothetical protein